MRKSIAFSLAAALVLSTLAPLASFAQDGAKPAGGALNTAAPPMASTMAVPSKTSKSFAFRNGHSGRHRHFHRNVIHRHAAKSSTWNKMTAKGTAGTANSAGAMSKATTAGGSGNAATFGSRKATTTTHKGTGAKQKAARTTGRHVA